MVKKAGFFSIFTLFIFPSFAMISELEKKALVAIVNGGHSTIISALEEHKAAIEKEAGALLVKIAPGAGAMASDIEAGAKIVSAVAGMVPGGSAVAGAANDVEAIAAAVQQSSGGVASTAGGSSSSAAQGSALVAAALAAEKTAKSGTGIGSRLLAGVIAAGSLAGVGIIAYSNWFSTNSSSSENEDAQRVDAYVGSIPAYAGLLGASLASGYYAVTNKWFNDTVAAAKLTTQAVTNHVNTVTPLLAQAQQKAAAGNN